MKYGYNDVTIIPAEISHINHRSECDPTDENDKLPIFTAPMSSIVNLNNIDTYVKNHITPIIPRNIPFEERLNLCKLGYWIAMSLDEFKNLDSSKIDKDFPCRICIDIANGHMASLYNAIKGVKKKFPSIIIMTGNIANPMTLHTAANAGVDYIRLGIGAGAGCITSSNTGIHYPMASLINDCYSYKKQWNLNIKLIADGGIRNYSDVNKALALGADYVMIGGLFAECVDSNKDLYIQSNGCYVKANDEDLQKEDIQLYHKFYGMASKEGMNDLHLKKHTAEGICKYIPIKYDSIEQWSENMANYLRSAMSYCNAKTLDIFIGKQQCILLSNNAQNAINK